MKNNKPNKKLKKVSEKERLEKLYLQFTMLQKLSEERILRYEELLNRSSKNSDEKYAKNLKRLEEARKTLEETLIFSSQVKESLETISQEKMKK